MPIVVQELSYIYMQGTPFERAALEGVNLTIGDGEFIAVIGHTGSGKTTLVQHFNGIFKPTAGKVVVNGIDTAEKHLKELRKQVGIVFQYPEYQLFEETVYKDIAFGISKTGLNSEEVKRRVGEVAEIVGITRETLGKSPFELSGGQKRRVAIAGVLVMKPSILVLDEPTAGLDPKGRDGVFEFIRTMHRATGMTIVMVSHSMEDVARLVDRVVVMNRGKVAMDGLVRDVFANSAALEGMGLRAPQISYLMGRLRSVMPELDSNIYTVGAAKTALMRRFGITGAAAAGGGAAI